MIFNAGERNGKTPKNYIEYNLDNPRRLKTPSGIFCWKKFSKSKRVFDFAV